MEKSADKVIICLSFAYGEDDHLHIAYANKESQKCEHQYSISKCVKLDRSATARYTF